MGSIHLPRARARAVAGGILALALVITASPVAAGGTLFGHFVGHSWGSRANATAGDIATALGRSAYQPCPCVSEGTNGETRSNSVDQLQADNVLRADVMVSSVNAKKNTDGTADIFQKSVVTGFRALGTRIRATEIQAVARTHADSDSIDVRTSGTRFGGLTILGSPVSDNVAPNTRREIPGFGYVILRETIRGGNGTSSRTIQVTMLKIVITRNNTLDIPVGAKILVGRAKSGYVRTEPSSVLDGGAWATSAETTTEDVKNRVGRAAAIYMPCQGTDGKLKTNFVHTVDAPGILSASTAYSTARGKVRSTSSYAVMSSTIEDLDALDGMITADAVAGFARVSWDSVAGGTASSTGSGFTNLRIAGVAIGDDQAPNSEYPLPNVGFVRFYEQTLTSGPDGAEAHVVMIKINVTSPTNTFGLPVGTGIQIARARAEAVDF